MLYTTDSSKAALIKLMTSPCGVKSGRQAPAMDEASFEAHGKEGERGGLWAEQ